MVENTYQLGIGSVEITPQIGVPLVGGVAPYPSDGIATRLWVKAMAIGDGAKTVLLVTMDNLKYPPSEEAVEALSQATGLPKEDIWITASHAHSCPYYLDYGQELLEAMIGASRQALADRTPCKLYTAKGTLGPLTGNRRVMKNGQCVNIWLLPKEERALWPEAGWPVAGQCDRDVLTLAAEDEAGKYKALLFNFACHACTSGATPTLISADYPGFTREYLDAALGYEVQTLFWPGACGDINARCDSRTLGEALAAVIASSLEDRKPVAGPLRTVTRQVLLKDRETAAFQEDTVAALWESSLEHFRESFAEAEEARQSHYPAQLSAVAIGDVLVMGVPGELFCEIGLDIKAAFPDRFLMVAEQTNGAIGYIPTEKAFRQGGYECLYGEHSVVAEDSEKIVYEESVAMLKQLA